MKFTRTITFSLISLIGIGTLFGITELNAAEPDRSFKITDQSGDSKQLGDQLFSAMIQTDTNSFEQVAFNKEKTNFRKVAYDLHFGADEKELANKDLYRGLFNPTEFENDKIHMTAEFNVQYPYTSMEPYVKLAVKNKKTDQVQKQKVVLDGFSADENPWHSVITEKGGELYYSFIVNGAKGTKSIIYTYKVDTDKATLTDERTAEVEGGQNPDFYNNVVDMKEEKGDIQVLLTTGEKEGKFVTYDPANGKTVEKPIVLEEGGMYAEGFLTDDPYIYVNSYADVLVIEKDNLSMKQKLSPHFDQEKYEHISVADMKSHDSKLYVIYIAYLENIKDYYVDVFDTKNGSLVYGGKMTASKNQVMNESITFFDKK